LLPRCGDVLRISREASVQFSTPILFRVIRVRDRRPYNGWLWLDGYQLNSAGEAVRQRSIYVRAGGLHRVTVPSAGAATGRRSGRRTGPRPVRVVSRPAETAEPLI
jgi:hypothetical protein